MLGGSTVRLHLRALLRARKAVFVCLFPVSMCFLSALSATAQQRASEEQVKAAYLFNFAKYVRWPEDDSRSFKICVAGHDPFRGVLSSTVAGETINNKAVQITRVDHAADVASCKILFVSASEQGRMHPLIAAAQQTLTVSDLPGFLDSGGMIEFVEENNRVRFQIDLEAAREHGLNVSSELLRVASKVRQR